MIKDIQKLYDQVVSDIRKIDMTISELQGKREAYSDIRLDLYDILNKTREVQENNE